MELDRKYIINFLVYLFFLFLLLGDIFPQFKYLKYFAVLFNTYILFLLVLIDTKHNKDSLVKVIGRFKGYLLMCAFLGIYSLLLQIIGSRFCLTRTAQEVFFILVPIIFCIETLIIGRQDIYSVFNNILIAYVAMFIIRFFDRINIRNLLSLDYFQSYSPFESEYAPIFSLLSFWFLLRNKKLQLVTCLFFLVLSMKRMEILVTILILLFSKLILKVKVNKAVFLVTLVVNFIILRFALYTMTPEFNEVFSELTGKSFNAFSMGRFEIISLLRNTGFENMGGFGYSTYYLRDVINAPEAFNVIHSDIIKLYLEIGSVGFLIFLILFYIPAYKNTNIYILSVVLNSFFIFNHVLDNLSEMLVFMMLVCGFAWENNKQIMKLQGRDSNLKLPDT